MATANNFLKIVQWIFGQANRTPPTSLASPNKFTQTVIDSVNEIQRFVTEQGKEEQWNSLHSSSTFVSVIGQRAYTLTGANDDIDPSIPLRRLFEVTTPTDLIELSEGEWQARTILSTPTNGVADGYRIVGVDTSSGRRDLLIELDPPPSAVITYTYEYWKEIPDLSDDAGLNQFVLLHPCRFRAHHSAGKAANRVP